MNEFNIWLNVIGIVCNVSMVMISAGDKNIGAVCGWLAATCWAGSALIGHF